MNKLIEIFAGRGLIVATVAAVLAMVATWRSDIKERGRQEVRASIEKNTDANAKKADAARAAADKLPASRLCDKYARDC